MEGNSQLLAAANGFRTENVFEEGIQSVASFERAWRQPCSQIRFERARLQARRSESETKGLQPLREEVARS
jgi:hypothetical protein